MVIEVLVGVALTGAFAYWRDKSFRAEVNTDVQNLQAEVANLKTKATTGVAVVEADFTKLGTLFSNLTKKL
jgi:hypothetical protein